MTTQDTDHFGFTRVSVGETMTKNGYAVLDTDRLRLDGLLYALENHRHDGSVRLDGPSVAPTGVVSTSGGSLPSGQTLYYAVSYVDQWGLETAPSPEVSVVTGSAISRPTAPVLTHYDSGGTLACGRYAYQITYANASGGETDGSLTANITTPGTCTGVSRIRLTFAAAPAGAPAIKIYRAKPGQQQYYYLDTVQAVTEYYDDGATAEDPTVVVPRLNNTATFNRVTVTIPGGAIPDDVISWKIYRATSPGSYGAFSLVHNVVEGLTDWDDTGSSLQLGRPLTRSSTIGGSPQITTDALAGQIDADALPRGARTWSVFCAATLIDDKTYAMTRMPLDLQLFKMTAYFQDTPSGLTSGATPTRVRFLLLDQGATPQTAELICDDDTAYYVREWSPLLEDSLEAEDGTRQGPITYDALASRNIAVLVSNQTTDYVYWDIGELPEGTYTPYVTLRRTGNVASDIRLRALDPDAPATLSTRSFGADGDAPVGVDPALEYVEYAGTSFTLTTPTSVRLYVDKLTATVNGIYVDSFRYTADDVPVLSAGDVTLWCEMDNMPATPTPGGNVQITLWY